MRRGESELPHGISPRARFAGAARDSGQRPNRVIGFQPMVAVIRDVDRYSDRICKSEAIF